MEAYRSPSGSASSLGLRVLPTPSTITGIYERRCAAGTPLRRSRKELTCRQEP